MARYSTGLLSLIAVACFALTANAQCPGGCPDGGNGSSCCPWNRPYTEESQPDVFYNFYQPGNGGSPAVSFPAPYPTPAYVGHSYYTYQPFMPNEWMYHHHRTYHQSYNNGMGLNRTSVRWYSPPIRTELANVRKFFTLPR